VGGDPAPALRARAVDARDPPADGGLHRDTISRAVRGAEPPVYRRAPAGSKLDPFKPEIQRRLGEDATLTGQRIRELIRALGFVGAKTIVDDYLREVRPLFATQRTYQRTVYRPGEICQFDLCQPRTEVPVGHGQTRRAWVVVACLGYSPRAPARVSSPPDAGSVVRDPALPVVARGAASDGGVGSPVRAARRRGRTAAGCAA
jgi:transposase